MVFKNLDNRAKAYWTLAIFVGISILFYVISDSFSLWMSTLNPWVNLLINILINPAYLFLIYILWTEYKLRGVFAGLLTSISIDLMTLPHSLSRAGIIPTSTDALPLVGYSDTTLGKILAPILSGQTLSMIIYIVIPLILIYLALRIIRRTSSFNKIFREAI